MVAKNGTKKQGEKSPMSDISLEYNLAELPSSQHRAGLAGLVLMVKWMEQQRKIGGICELTRLDENGATLRIDANGLKALFAETYDHTEGEELRDEPKTRAKSKKPVPVKDIRKREEIDPETGERKDIPIYVYPTYTPKGALLLNCDSTANDAGKGIWVELWRDFIWNVVRKKDPARNIYRDKSNHAKAANKLWSELTLDEEPSKLSGTDMIGARAYDAEEIPFQDKAKQKLLLHFWSYIAQIYLPTITVINKKTKKPELKEFGYALAIPEVTRLETFCKLLPQVLHKRNKEHRGFRQRPRDSVIDVPAEGALDLFIKLNEQITLSESARATSRVVSAIDVIHVDASGQDVSIKSTTRIEPESFKPDEYERVRRGLKNHEFRKQRVLNILNGREEWYADFDKLLCRLPLQMGFEDEHFAHDARESFEREVKDLKDEKKMNVASEDLFATQNADDEDTDLLAAQDAKNTTNPSAKSEPKSRETLVYEVVGRYLNRKVEDRYKTKWEDVKDDQESKDEHNKNRRKLATDAFYNVRSRTGEDFIEYFVATLCSVSQNMTQEDYESLARALYDNPDKIRALTMLALSARK